jgi:hypothetical protein
MLSPLANALEQHRDVVCQVLESEAISVKRCRGRPAGAT